MRKYLYPIIAIVLIFFLIKIKINEIAQKEAEKRTIQKKIVEEEYPYQTKYLNCLVYKINNEDSLQEYLAIDIYIKETTITFFDIQRDRVVTLVNASVTINEYRQ